MTFTTWKLNHYPYNGATKSWSASATELTEVYQPSVRLGLGGTRDTFDFKVNNTHNDYDLYFRPNDKVELSMVVNSTTVGTSDLLIAGIVQGAPEDVKVQNDFVRVEGASHTETLLNALAFVDAQNLTIPQAIQAGLSSIQAFNDNFKVTWHPSNPTLTSSGGAFPLVGEKWYYKPFNQLVETYSASNKTTDGQYYFYVDNQNRLVWRKKSSVVSATAFNSETTNHYSLSITKDINDVRNFIIVKCGIDPDGTPITAKYFDASSASKHGIRYYVLTSIAKDAQTVVGDDKTAFGVTNMADATYPLTPSWSGSSFASYSAYVDGLRLYIRQLGKEAGKAFAATRANGKLKVEVEMSPNKTWGLAEVVPCTIAKVSAVVKPLRVVDIVYEASSTKYTFEEDEGSL